MGRLLNSKMPLQPATQAAGTGTTVSRFPSRQLPPPASRPFNPIPIGAKPKTAEQDVVRKFAFASGLSMLFVRMAVLPELLFAILHVNTYLLYLVGPPAILGAVFTGAIGRTMRHPAAWMWMGFFCCMASSVPFSSWVGGSMGAVQMYAEFSLPMLFIIGGLGVSWREIRAIFTTIGAAGVAIIVASRFMVSDEYGRVDLSAASTTIGNSNDLASHFILLLPFLLYIAMDRGRLKVIRFAMIFPAAYALWTIFGTGSRGALIALVVSFLFVLVRATTKQRAVAVAAAAVLTVSVPMFLNGNALMRLASLFGEEHEEAKESGDSRSYLLKQSILYTLEHPVFGVGVDQFSNFEGGLALVEGRNGNWHATHNAFTQVSSECGIPALVFFVLGIGMAFHSAGRTYSRAKAQGNKEVADAGFCYLLAMVGYLVSIVFLANAYRFYLPVMIGLALAYSSAAGKEMATGLLKEPATALPRKNSPLPPGTRPARP